MRACGTPSPIYYVAVHDGHGRRMADRWGWLLVNFTSLMPLTWRPWLRLPSTVTYPSTTEITAVTTHITAEANDASTTRKAPKTVIDFKGYLG